ncbi:MAG: FtsQ-type POTRA domain-containing protein [Synechococcaceae cyanobacterium]|nr:FtsQ-type POTRA domain-containing protein [Synechococcaceae cyanobacterium]
MSGTPLPPGVQRRKELRRQRRTERLRNLWRAFVFSALAAGVGYGLLRQGWSLQGPGQVEVLGSRRVGREQVIQAADLRFPQPLLAVQPRQMGRRLRDALPVEQVRVSRLMLPPRLRIELTDREAVARAERRRPGGTEKGYVDRGGNWINVSRNPALVPRGDVSLLVTGWNERHRSALVKVFAAREAIGKDLQEVRFAPDGSLWLRTARLGEVRLGPPDDRLERRLEVAAHLNRSLPTEVRGRRPRLIDLTDPEQPELSFGAPLTPPAADGPEGAQAPPGGQ